LTQEATSIRATLQEYQRLEDTASSLRQLLKGATSGELTLLESELSELEHRVEQLYRECLFTAEHSERNAILTVRPGAGGTESCDWAEMLLRMYRRYAERQGFTVEVLELARGEAAGITSGTLLIQGYRAYGLLAVEAGVHRLVRLSPFDAAGRRHTSFAAVSVSPELDEADDVQINPADVKIDVYRAGGHGGQGVNTTDSAVRIHHLPTGLIVTCQNERSQIQNKATALKILRARLRELAQRQKEAELAQARGAQPEIAWGSQIRSYVLDQSRIKDLRTGVERFDPDRVLDGDLDEFIYAALEWQARRRAQTQPA